MFFLQWCSCTQILTQDSWNIIDEALIDRGEIGAGWLNKRARSKALWNRRFFTLTSSKLLYYTESSRRDSSKGSLVIAGSEARISATRTSTPQKKYFVIIHPECGTREFYANTNQQRKQWIEAINSLSAKLRDSSVYGTLRKLSRSASNVWEDRWCICVGNTFDYFEAANDNVAKGSIGIYYWTFYSVFNCF